MTHVDVKVVPENAFVELAKNPKGSKRCALKIKDDWIAPFDCVNVHFPVSAPDNAGYVNVYVNPVGEAFVNNVPIVVRKAESKYEPTGTLISTVVSFSCK